MYFRGFSKYIIPFPENKCPLLRPFAVFSILFSGPRRRQFISGKGIAFLFLLIMSSCSWWGGNKEKEGEPKSFTISDKKELNNAENCLEDVYSFFGEYFQGKTSADRVAQQLSCTKNAIDQIFLHAEESDKKRGFSKKEVQNVLKTVFPKKDIKETVMNVAILFTFKKVFVGGEDDYFTREEWKNIKQNWSRVSDILIAANEEIRIFFYGKEMDYQKREDIFRSLEAKFKKLDTIKNYLGGEVTPLEIKQIIEYVFSNKNFTKYKPLAEVVTKFMFINSGNLSLSQNYFFERIFYALELQSRFQSVKFEEEFFWGSSIYELQRVTDIIATQLLYWGKLDETYSIDNKILFELIEALKGAGIMSEYLVFDAQIKQFIASVFKRVFKTDVYSLNAFEKSYKIVFEWIRKQNSILTQYDFDWLKKGGQNKNLNTYEEPIFSIPYFTSEEFISYNILEKELSSRQAYFDESFKNLLSVITKYVVQAYGQTQNEGAVLNLDNLKTLMDDFRALGLKLGAMNPYNCGTEKRVFIEGASLTFNANGDEFVDTREATEWLGLMLSVSSITNHFYQDLKEECFYKGFERIGYRFANRNCVFNSFIKNKERLIKIYPTMRNYLEILSDEDKLQDFQKNTIESFWDRITNLLSPMGKFPKTSYESFYSFTASSFNICPMEDFPVDRGELNSLTATLFYIENIFMKFDRENYENGSKKDEVLNVNELKKFIEFNFSKQKKDLLEEEALYEKLYAVVNGDMVKLDRVRTLFFLNGSGIVGYAGEKTHVYGENFCRDVYTTRFNSINYNQTEVLMCTPERVRKQSLPY